MHHVSKPEILYFGTPVVLISTCNEDGTANLAPISSVFWLGWRCVVGISGFSKTTENMIRTRECVLNLPSVKEVSQVNLLARTTGSNPVPPGKKDKGYNYVHDKFGISGFTPVPSLTVMPPRVHECPVQLEATVEDMHSLAKDDETRRGAIMTIELRIQRVHLHENVVMEGNPNRVDPDKWRPLIMSFQQFYGLGNQLCESTLARIDEKKYHSKDMDTVRTIVTAPS